MDSILYVSFLNEDIRPGYKNKLHSQAKTFMKIGYDPYLFIMTNRGFKLYKYKKDDRTKVYEIPFFHNRKKEKRNIYDEIFTFQEFTAHVKKIVYKLNIKIIYIRRIVPITPMLLSLLRTLKVRGVKIIYEYPTFPWKEEMKQFAKHSISRKLFYVLDSIQYKKLIELPDMITYMGFYHGNDMRFFGIQNCGDKSIYPCRKHKEKTNEIILLAVAHTSFSHGYDIVIHALKKYYDKNPDRKVFFYIVGDISGTPELKQLVNNYSLNDYVKFEGYAVGKKLDSYYQIADIGVNKVRIENEEIAKAGLTTLKTVEYTFRGLPQISGAGFAIDKDMADIPEFLCVMDQNSFDIYKVIEFYDKIDYEPVKIRDYAIHHMEWEKLFRKMIDRLNRME